MDEQLFPTKVRCKWTQYIASKPEKLGIKFWLAVDVASKFLVNGFPYWERTRLDLRVCVLLTTSS